MARSGRPPFRADQIGSLLRPEGLRRGFKARASGEISADEFADVQHKAIRDAVIMQQQAGFKVATDGEFRRGSYWSEFVERVRGLSVKDALFRFRDDQGHESAFTAPYVEDRVSRAGAIAVDEFAALERITGPLGLTAKITLPAPSSMHFWRGRSFGVPGVYGTPAEFFSELAAIYRDELADLASAGCTYVQLDEVALAMLCDENIRDRLGAQGDDPQALTRLYIDAINEAVRDRPSSMRVGLHLCRGNYKGLHLAQGGYEPIAEALFEHADVDHFLLEFDTPRAGEFGPLRLVPQSKGVVLGLVCSKSSELEPLSVLCDRVEAAARFIDLDQLAVSPQCGFASTAAGNPVLEDVQRAKLSRVAETAEAIWG